MSESDLVAERLGDEDILATVTLSGDDKLVITPSRSLLYEAEGLISDESVTEYPHRIESISLSSGRRKSTIELTYPLEGTKSIRVPKASVESVLHYLLAGVLNARSITDPGEVVRAVYLFNELTVIITSERIVTNVGTSVWDEDHDEYRYDDLSGLEFEEGDVATQIVLYVDGRSQRIKVPKSRAKKLRHELREAVFEKFNISSMTELSEVLDDTDGSTTEDSTESEYPFDDVVEPLASTTSDTEPQESSEVVDLEEPLLSTEETSSASIDNETRAEIEPILEDLEQSIDEQRALIATQVEAIEELIETISNDR